MAPELVQLPDQRAAEVADLAQRMGAGVHRAGHGAAGRDAGRDAPRARPAAAARGRARAAHPPGVQRRHGGAARSHRAARASGGAARSHRPIARPRPSTPPPGVPRSVAGARAGLRRPLRPAATPTPPHRRRPPPPGRPAPAAAAAPARTAPAAPAAPAPAAAAAPAPAAPCRRLAAARAVAVWATDIMPSLKSFTRAIYAATRLIGERDGTVVVGAPNEAHRDRCRQHQRTSIAIRVGRRRAGAGARWWSTASPRTTTPRPEGDGRCPPNDAYPATTRPTTRSTSSDLVDAPPESVVSPTDRLLRPSPARRRSRSDPWPLHPARADTHRRARPAARHRPEVGAAHRVPPAEDPHDDVARLAIAITEAKAKVRFCARCWNVAEGELCRSAPTTAATAGVRRGGVARHRRHREDRRVPGSLSRAAGGHQPDRGHRSRAAEDEGAARPHRARGRAGGHPLHEPQHRGRGDRDVPRPPDQAARVRVTRIASGLPVGGDLEYADELTLGRALEGRRDVTA